MEAAEALNDATPPLIEDKRADEIEVVTLDDSDVQIIEENEEPAESQDEPIPGETEAGWDIVEAVIEHADAAEKIEEKLEEEAPVEEPIEDVRVGGETTESAEMEDDSLRGTLPMLDETGGGDDFLAPAETAETSEGATTADTGMKDDDATQSTEGESSQAAAAEEQFVPANLPATFPHCYVCGFDRETVFMREKKASSGPHKNKLIYKNRCVRKQCIRFFGPSYVWDGKAGEYVRIAEESAAASRPYANGTNGKKFPATDYERANASGVRPPLENNGSWARAMGGEGATSTTTAQPPLERYPRTASVSDAAVASTSGGSPAPKSASASSSTKPSPTAAAPAARKTTTPKPKKLRKGYQWVAEDERPPPPRVDPVIELARIYAAQNKAEKAIKEASISLRTFGTQTGDEDQVVLTLVDEMRTRAVFTGLRPSGDVPMTPSGILSLSNRLFLTQKALRSQSDEIKSLRAERDMLRGNIKKVVELFTEYRKTLVIDTTRLKEDVVVANRELKSFSIELQNEANKDIREIKKIKEQIAKRLDDSEHYRRKVEKSLEVQKSAAQEAERLMDNYHQMAVELEKKILVSKMEENDAKSKLNDKIYLTNNAKCTHCHVNEKIKNMLTEQIADKTLSATNLGKEREALARKLENAERCATIQGNENKQLKFEKAAWESNCHRFRNELLQLKGNNAGLVLPSSLPSSVPSSVAPGEAAFTPQSTTTKDADEVSPERMDDDVMEVVDRPPPSSSASSAEEGEYQSPKGSPYTLARLPPPPPPPTASQLNEPSPDHAHAFASWIPKDRKAPEQPDEMAAAFRRVAEQLERGPPPKKEEKGGHKKKRDEKASSGGGGKRSGGSQQFSHSHGKNGEKKLKLDAGARKVPPPPPPSYPRPIPILGSKSVTQSPVMPQKDKKKEERIRDPSPVPFSSTHEPAFPAVVAAQKAAVKVPYNGPSSLVAGSSTPSSTSSPIPMKNASKAATPEKKKPLSFLPVAGSIAKPQPPSSTRDHAAPPPLPSFPSSSRPITVDSIIREAERLKAIERDRDIRRGQQQPPAMHRGGPYQDPMMGTPAADRRGPPLGVGGSSGGFSGGFDDDLPWNAGRPTPNYQTTGRPRTPVQDWYAPPVGHGPPPQQPRAPSPGRYFDDMYNPHAPRDQYGRLEPDFGLPRQHPHHQLPPHLQLRPLPPPGHFGGPPAPQGPSHLAPHPQGPPPHDAWRREWHGEPPRRGYWD